MGAGMGDSKTATDKLGSAGRGDGDSAPRGGALGSVGGRETADGLALFTTVVMGLKLPSGISAP